MKVAIVGNGNWGTAVAKLVAENVRRLEAFSDEVILYTHEEIYKDRKLSEWINEEHSNPRYLPGVDLPSNICARTTLDMEDIDVFVFCLPHQFLNVLKDMKKKVGAFGINLGKGLIQDGEQLCVPSEYIGRMLGMECSCMMGANIASEVAQGVLSDSTIGCVGTHRECFAQMFTSDYFVPDVVDYSRGLEVCGAVKNIISVAYGIAYGRGWGSNTLAMLFRRGLLEIKRLCGLLGGEVDALESACVGDLLVSCLCGRNYKCGAAVGGEGATVVEFEESLDGQKLQGPGTAKTIVDWLGANGHGTGQFPLITAVYRICFEKADLEILKDALKKK